MKVYACSDLHVSPAHFSDQARAFLEEAAQEADLTLFCGDIYEGSWCELEESFESENGQELLSLIQVQPKAVVLLGNHDMTLDQYLVDIKHPVLKSYQFNADGRRYYATHGWVEYDLALSVVAPIYRWLFPLLPALVKWWTRRNSPRTLKLKAMRSKGHSDLYWRHVRAMSNEAIFHAIGKGWTPIWGHSHRRHIDWYEKWLAINCGDFSEDDIGGVVIEGGVPRDWAATP